MNDNNLWARGSIHGDEYYTLPKVAQQITDHILDIPHLKVWCPFNDTKSVWGGT